MNELGLSGGALAALAGLIVLQLALQVTALVQLVKTPAERVSIGGRKWAWALIIILGEIAGPILWFVLGRRAAEVAQPDREAACGERAQAAVDALYGDPPSTPTNDPGTGARP